MGVLQEMDETEEFLGFSVASERRVSFCLMVRGWALGFVFIEVFDWEWTETEASLLVAVLSFLRRSMPIVLG